MIQKDPRTERLQHLVMIHADRRNDETSLSPRGVLQAGELLSIALAKLEIKFSWPEPEKTTKPAVGILCATTPEHLETAVLLRSVLYYCHFYSLGDSWGRGKYYQWGVEETLAELENLEIAFLIGWHSLEFWKNILPHLGLNVPVIRADGQTDLDEYRGGKMLHCDLVNQTATLYQPTLCQNWE